MFWAWILPSLQATETVGKLQPAISWEKLPVSAEKLLNTWDFGSAHVPFNSLNFDSLVSAALAAETLDEPKQLKVAAPKNNFPVAVTPVVAGYVQ